MHPRLFALALSTVVILTGCCAPQAAGLGSGELTAFNAVVLENEDVLVVALEPGDRPFYLNTDHDPASFRPGEDLYVQGYLQGNQVKVTTLTRR